MNLEYNLKILCESDYVFTYFISHFFINWVFPKMQLIDFFIHKLDTTLNLSWKVSELQMILIFFCQIYCHLLNEYYTLRNLPFITLAFTYLITCIMFLSHSYHRGKKWIVCFPPHIPWRGVLGYFYINIKKAFLFFTVAGYSVVYVYQYVFNQFLVDEHLDSL